MTIQKYLEEIRRTAITGRRVTGTEFDMLCEVERLSTAALELLSGVTEAMVEVLRGGDSINA